MTKKSRQNIIISWDRNELLRWNRKHSFIILKKFHFICFWSCKRNFKRINKKIYINASQKSSRIALSRPSSCINSSQFPVTLTSYKVRFVTKKRMQHSMIFFSLNYWFFLLIIPNLSRFWSSCDYNAKKWWGICEQIFLSSKYGNSFPKFTQHL